MVLFMVLKARFIETYEGFHIMLKAGEGYFIMLTVNRDKKVDNIMIIEDEYYDTVDLAKKEIDRIYNELGKNAKIILTARAYGDP